MNNSAEIRETRFEVTLEATVVTPASLKIILVVLWFILLSLAVFVISSFGSDPEDPKGILVCFLGFSMILFFFGKYVAWNIWGREWIKVTTRSILHSRSYGLYALPAKTIMFDYLATHVEITKEHDGLEYGVINLYDRNPATMQLILKYNSGVNLPVSLLADFAQKIHTLFAADEENDVRWLPFSHN